MTIKSKTVTLQALAQAAQLELYGKELEAIGAVIHMAPNVLSVMLDGSPLSIVKVNTEALPYFIKGQMNTYSAKMVSEKVADLLADALKHPNAKEKLQFLPVKGIMENLPEPDSASEANPTIKKSQTAKGPKAAVAAAPKVTGPKVKLAEATKLHQPVFGTSKGSTYHVVALGEGVNAAIRLYVGDNSNWKLSLRVEGPEVGKYESRLNQADIGYKGGYASQHLSGTGGKIMARRAFGALIMSTGIPFQQVSTDPMALAGLGEG